MRLKELLPETGGYALTGPPEIDIRGLTDDSRLVQPGWLFACLRGLKDNGCRFIPEAAARGASALLTEEAIAAGGLAVVTVPDTRLSLSLMACAFYNHPSRLLKLYGITGTNGKTTTSMMVEWILNACGCPTGLIGTIQIRYGDRRFPARHTTPGPVEFQKHLDAMVKTGMRACTAEISSHALAQKRVAGAKFAGAILTNIERDHFDYHLTYQAYLAAKTALFSMLPAGDGLAVLNHDDPVSLEIKPSCRCAVVTYGLKRGADLRGSIGWSGPDRQLLEVEWPGTRSGFCLPMPGNGNAANALAALALVAAAGTNLEDACQALSSFPGLPGRFEGIDCGQPFTVLVDYAHNPAALRQILDTVRPHTNGRVIVVFGCEGEKDKGKRPLMGEIAAQAADHAIITCDNLHREEAWPIFSQIREGFFKGRRGRRPPYRLLFSRREAINRALRMAGAGDTVIIAGKGHESHLIIGDQALPFDDRQVVREILNGL